MIKKRCPYGFWHLSFSMYLFAIIVFLMLFIKMYADYSTLIHLCLFCPFNVCLLCFLWHIDFIKRLEGCEFISFEFARSLVCSVEIYGSTVSKEHPIFYDFLHRFWNMYLILRANLAHHRNCIINHFYFGWNCDLLCLNKHCC